MTYTAILVHVQADDRARPRLDCAVDLSRRFGATLIGLGAEMVPPMAPNDGFYAIQGGWFEAVNANLEANLKKAHAVFETASAGLVPAPVWRTAFKMPAEAMSEAARGADLIVASLAQAGHEESYHDAAPARMVITAGRPVLLAPAKAGPLSGSRVVVAWKDTREARRALSDALPFLRAAKQVLVLEVCGRDEEEDAAARTADVAAALTRHGVSAASKVVCGGAAGHVIRDEAEAYGADLIVAGAYGHSRWGEWVFGGVTRDLIVQNERYVLLSH